MHDMIQSIYAEAFFFFPDRLKTEKMCNEAVKLDTSLFYKVPGKFLTVEICQDTVKDDRCTENHTCWGMYLTILRQTKCVKKQSKMIHGH